MAKHVNPEKHDTSTSDYEPRHKGGRDAWDWAEYSNATAETKEIPKVDDTKRKW